MYRGQRLQTLQRVWAEWFGIWTTSGPSRLELSFLKAFPLCSEVCIAPVCLWPPAGRDWSFATPPDQVRDSAEVFAVELLIITLYNYITQPASFRQMSWIHLTSFDLTCKGSGDRAGRPAGCEGFLIAWCTLSDGSPWGSKHLVPTLPWAESQDSLEVARQITVGFFADRPSWHALLLWTAFLLLRSSTGIQCDPKADCFPGVPGVSYRNSDSKASCHHGQFTFCPTASSILGFDGDAMWDFKLDVFGVALCLFSLQYFAWDRANPLPSLPFASKDSDMAFLHYQERKLRNKTNSADGWSNAYYMPGRSVTVPQPRGFRSICRGSGSEHWSLAAMVGKGPTMSLNRFDRGISWIVLDSW